MTDSDSGITIETKKEEAQPDEFFDELLNSFLAELKKELDKAHS